MHDFRKGELPRECSEAEFVTHLSYGTLIACILSNFVDHQIQMNMEIVLLRWAKKWATMTKTKNIWLFGRIMRIIQPDTG